MHVPQLDPFICYGHSGCFHDLELVTSAAMNIRVSEVSEVTQSCLTLCDPMDCSIPASSVHGIFQARVLEWGAAAFSITSWQIDG